jgi:hypothetical protein
MDISGRIGYRDCLHHVCCRLRNLSNLNGGLMNPDRIDGNEKIKQILINYLRVWELMDRDQLISQLIEEKRFFLETELEYGNEEYLDELLAEDA